MDKEKIIESLSPHERKIIPYLDEPFIEICKKSNLDKISVTRALEYLNNKGIIKLAFEKIKIIDLGENGIIYRKNGLPERRLLNSLREKRILKFDEAQKEASLDNDEFKAAIGALKNKGIIDLKNKKIILNSGIETISKKLPEESLLELLPIEYSSLSSDQMETLKIIHKRKNLIETKEEKKAVIEITELGKEIVKSEIKEGNLIEQITPEILKNEKSWKGKKFRRYDVKSSVPSISGGKRNFILQAGDYARKIWTDLGFREMEGDFIQSAFWNFDALFTPQDHPAREMQDTFFLDKKTNLPEKNTVKSVKQAHEKGIGGSRGWQYEWNEEEAKKVVLRTHTTCLSAKTIESLKQGELPAKFFALGKVFRNETIDWKHGFEFHQTEGIVVDRNVNFRHLLGYLKQFFNKMGFEKVRFRPAYFPYTEPSVEVDVWNSERNEWVELAGAGIFRPEIVIPLLGENVPVLAWGLGFDRIITDYYKIKDIRVLYKNDISYLRTVKFWTK